MPKLIVILLVFAPVAAAADVTFIPVHPQFGPPAVNLTARIDNLIGVIANDTYSGDEIVNLDELVEAIDSSRSVSLQHQIQAANDQIILSGSAMTIEGGGGIGVYGFSTTKIAAIVTDAPVHYQLSGVFSGGMFGNASVILRENNGPTLYSVSGSSLVLDSQGFLAPGDYRLEVETYAGVGGAHEPPIAGASYDLALLVNFGPSQSVPALTLTSATLLLGALAAIGFRALRRA